MEEVLINESGYFWWSDEPLEQNSLIPKNSLAGSLRVDKNGLATLELHGMLSGGRSLFSNPENSEWQSSKNIQGLLKGTTRYVLLMELSSGGSTFSNVGISHESYQAFKILVSHRKFPPKEKLKYHEIEINLTGYDDWILNRSLITSRKSRTLTVKYSEPKQQSYKIKDGSRISITHDLLAPYNGDKRRKVELLEISTLSYKRKKGTTLKELSTIYSRLQDILFLFTGVTKKLDWPRLKFGTPRQKCTYYFFRQDHRESEVKWHECWLRMIDVEEDFGEIFDEWQKKHEEVGPGFYLLIGTARAQKNYIENKYVSLIWGLESLHRKTNKEEIENKPLQIKIQRILDSIPLKKDKDWLSDRLKHASEPALQQRLVDIFKKIPLDFKDKELIAFCKSCADRRNDISHFGGQRHSQTYQEFIDELAIKCDALLVLYHACVLLETGVKPEKIKSALKSAPGSFTRLESLRRAGLMTL